MVKETENFDREMRVRSTCFVHLRSVLKGDIGCLLALAGRYKPPTSFCHKPYEITLEPQSRAPHLLSAGRVIHSHKHTVELVSESEVAQSCLTLCDPMDCSLPGSSIHGIFQAGVLEWVAISFSRGSSQPGDRTQVSHIAGGFFNQLSHKGSPERK